MLVLTRKENESIMINDHVEIVVIGIEEGKVKLGINAPRDIRIHRKEVFDEIKRENKQAVFNKVDMNQIKNMIKK